MELNGVNGLVVDGTLVTLVVMKLVMKQEMFIVMMVCVIVKKNQTQQEFTVEVNVLFWILLVGNTIMCHCF